MRPVSRLLGWTVLALLAFHGTARAENVTFNTDYQPNVINLWSNVPFQLPVVNVNSWSVGYFDPLNPGFIQLVRSGGFGSLSAVPPQPAWLTYGQPFNGTVTTNPAWKMDWQEVYWNTASNTITQGFAGRLQSNGAGITNGTYGATAGLGPTLPGGAPLFIGPTPEPSSMIAFGLGFGIVAAARRRRAARLAKSAV